MNGQTIRPELRSLTYRQGDRILVGEPPPAPSVADRCEKAYGGHVMRERGCQRCGKT